MSMKMQAYRKRSEQGKTVNTADITPFIFRMFMWMICSIMCNALHCVSKEYNQQWEHGARMNNNIVRGRCPGGLGMH